MSKRNKRVPAALLDNAWLVIAAATAIGTVSYYGWRWLQQEVDPKPEQISTTKPSTRKPKVTIYTNDLIFGISSDVNYTLSGRELLISCIQRFELYIITKAPTDDLRQQTLELLRPLLPPVGDGHDDRRVLFCETDEGRIHMVRHISPEYHLDASNDDAALLKMHTFVGKVISVGTAKPHPNIDVINNLSDWKLVQ